MTNTTSTPPNWVKAIFPMKGNEKAVNEAAIFYGVIAYPEKNLVLFEGSLMDYFLLQEALKGGVLA